MPARARSHAGLSGVIGRCRALRRAARAGRRSLHEAAKCQSRQNRTGKKRPRILAAKRLDVFQHLSERLLFQRGGQPLEPACGSCMNFEAAVWSLLAK